MRAVPLKLSSASAAQRFHPDYSRRGSARKWKVLIVMRSRRSCGTSIGQTSASGRKRPVRFWWKADFTLPLTAESATCRKDVDVFYAAKVKE